MITSLYIHVPFCLRKCNYCDFYSLPVSAAGNLFQEYPRLLEKELSLWQEQLEAGPFSTIYFGGGTPSLLEADSLHHFLSLLKTEQAEITLEANPESLNARRLLAFREAGINRLSLGAQSFVPGQLEAMGRGHSPEQTRQAVQDARKAGFENIGLDLIFGLPGQSLVDWEAELEAALALETEHISLYGLTISRDCPWGEAGQQPLNDDLQADMLELAIEKLNRAGILQYEIANFARPGFASRHNRAYWRRENYLGLGPAAAGCIRNHRWNNANDLPRWAAAIEKGELPLEGEELLSMDQVIAEAMFLGLRLLEGISCPDFAAQYGLDPRKRFKREISRMKKAGLLEEEENRLRLSHRGILLGDAVFAEFV
ncbi:MAG: radical SAM family heme chaperone HemW [Bacillota bacterium]|nr:radical SAM family heme chaperone HemW [Bacillota bacterium]